MLPNMEHYTIVLGYLMRDNHVSPPVLHQFGPRHQSLRGLHHHRYHSRLSDNLITSCPATPGDSTLSLSFHHPPPISHARTCHPHNINLSSSSRPDEARATSAPPTSTWPIHAFAQAPAWDPNTLRSRIPQPRQGTPQGQIHTQGPHEPEPAYACFRSTSQNLRNHTRVSRRAPCSFFL